MHRLLALSILAAIAAAASPAPVRAETINCTNITSLPAVISTQGVYCLKQDLATSIGTGAAITVATNNVTIDCNGYKLGGLAAGPQSLAVGIQSSGRHNISVRNCGVRGFYMGISIKAGTGQLVEDNRVDSSLFIGITTAGEGSVIRRNRVYDTGPETGTDQPIGIMGAGNMDILDNIVSGVATSSTSSSRAIGIWVYQNVLGSVEGNRVRDLWTASAGKGTGFFFTGSGGAAVVGNRVANYGGIGADCSSGSSVLMQNTFVGFTTAIVSCDNGGGNLIQAF